MVYSGCDMVQDRPITELIRLEIDGPCCEVILDRADKYNALNVQMISELIEVFEWTANNSVAVKGSLTENGAENLRILVLRGEGKHFCAGADKHDARCWCSISRGE